MNKTTMYKQSLIFLLVTKLFKNKPKYTSKNWERKCLMWLFDPSLLFLSICCIPANILKLIIKSKRMLPVIKRRLTQEWPKKQFLIFFFLPLIQAFCYWYKIFIISSNWTTATTIVFITFSNKAPSVDFSISDNMIF